MKNFFKKLSFVLASAMVITSLYAPANTSAAAKDGIILKGKAVTKKGIFVGGEKVNFDYKIGKHNNKGANGKWSVSDTSVITVDKHGKVTAVGTGSATLYLKVKKNAKKGIKKNWTFKVKINAMARADKLTIPASDKAITLKVGEVKDIMPVLTDKVEGVKNTYTLFAKSSDDSVATAKAENGKVVVEAKMATSSAVTVTVFAAQKNSAEEAMNNKYKVEDSFTVTVKDLFSVEQSAANKVKVTGENLVSSASSYVIKSDKGVSISVKSVEVNADKTEAIVLTDVYQIPEGKYNLTHNAKETADFMAEVAKTKEIKVIPSDKASGIYEYKLVGANYVNTGVYKSARVNYKVFDQFGNDITDTSIPQLVVTGSYDAKRTKNGEIIFGNGVDTVFQLNITQFFVSIIDKKSQASVTANLVLGDANQVASAEYFSLWDDSKKKTVTSISEGDADRLKDFYILFSAKDQYGNDVTEKGYGSDIYVNLISIANLRATNANKVVTVDGKKYLAFSLAKADDKSPLRKDSVKVQAIILSNGKAVNGQFDVTFRSKVDRITVVETGKGVYNGTKNELQFTALDTDGKIITDADTLMELNNDKRMTDGLKFEKDEKGVAHLYYTPTGITVSDFKGSVSQPLLFRTMTEKFDTTTVNIKFKKFPVAILGVNSDAVTGATRTNEIVLKANDIRFQDQYGADMTAEEIVDLHGKKAYSVKVEFEANEEHKNAFAITAPTNASATPFGRTPIEAKDTEIAKITANGNDDTNVKVKESYMSQVKLTLMQNTKSDLSTNTNAAEGDYVAVANANMEPAKVAVYNVRLDDVKNITVKDLKTLPVIEVYDGKEADARKTHKPEVFGYYEGKKINLVQGTDFTILGGIKTDGQPAAETDAATAVIPVPKKADLERAQKTTMEAKFKVVILTSTPKDMEKAYNVSLLPAHVVKATIKDGKKEVELTAKKDGSTSKDWEDIGNLLDLEDQYGNKILDHTYYVNAEAPNVAYTYVPKEDQNANDVEFVGNGTQKAQVKFKGSGINADDVREVKVKIFFARSGKTFEGKIKLTAIN